MENFVQILISIFSNIVAWIIGIVSIGFLILLPFIFNNGLFLIVPIYGIVAMALYAVFKDKNNGGEVK